MTFVKLLSFFTAYFIGQAIFFTTAFERLTLSYDNVQTYFRPFLNLPFYVFNRIFLSPI